ncbi:MAG: sigma-70 family RNA polymerase sigma factor [Ruminococcaceae bacterium]|nr:sigma-70 family RNA polymerase sigma factor [Oscillospiraceae bacterium]
MLIIGRYLANNTETLEILLHAYADALVRYAYCYVGDADVAEDIMEDAFALYIAKKIEFDTKEQIRCWLYKTVRSRAVDYLRRHKREVSFEGYALVLSTPDVYEDVVRKERNAAVFRNMQKLNQDYRAVLQLHYFDGFKVEQICEILKKEPKQVYNLLTRARASLKELLIKEGITHEDL